MAQLNLTYLNDLADGDQDFVHEVLGIFRDHTPAELNKLQIAFETEDRETIKLIAHKLKSSAANLGMEDARQKFIRIEELIKAGNSVSDTKNLVSEVIHDCREAIRETITIIG